MCFPVAAGCGNQAVGAVLTALPTPTEGDGYLFHGSFFYRFLSESDAAGMLEGCGFRVLDVGLRTWSEPPHPNFRAQAHVHTSRVFLAERVG